MSVLEELRDELRRDGGLLAAALRDTPEGEPLAHGERAEVALLLEAIREGYELHYGRSRLVDTADEDLAIVSTLSDSSVSRRSVTWTPSGCSPT